MYHRAAVSISSNASNSHLHLYIYIHIYILTCSAAITRVRGTKNCGNRVNEFQCFLLFTNGLSRSFVSTCRCSG